MQIGQRFSCKRKASGVSAVNNPIIAKRYSLQRVSCFVEGFQSSGKFEVYDMIAICSPDSGKQIAAHIYSNYI
jgi:hypothetical protein